MKSIIDTTQNMSGYRKNIEGMRKLADKVKALGGVVNDEIWPTIDEIDYVRKHPKHFLFKKYYGTDDLVYIYNIVEKQASETGLPDFAKDFVTKWRNARSRQTNMNELYEFSSWGTNYDPVSRVIIIASIMVAADNAAFGYDNEDKKWLMHNLGYYAKIGLTSQYYPQLLRKSEKDYEREEDIPWSDKTIDYAARAIVLMQKMLEGIKLKPAPLDKVHEEALSKNNKSAESAPGFRNQKNEDTRAEVLADAEACRENATWQDIQIINEQRRIQSGGNVLFESYYQLQLDPAGHIIFDVEQVKLAIFKCAQERGYFTLLYEEAPQILAGLENLIQINELPLSEAERSILVQATGDDKYLKKDRVSGDWRYKYEIQVPNIFVKVKDKFPEIDDIGDKPYAKTRSIKAAMSSHSRLGQSYLYPFMEAWKEKCLKTDSPYFSIVAQWSHPDDLKMAITSWVDITSHELLKGQVDDLLIDESKLEGFEADSVASGLIREMSSDDKTGFDTYNHPIVTYAFYCMFLSVPFDMDADNARILKYLAMNDILCLMSGVDDLILYTNIIASGQFSTSVRGTFSSNLASLMKRQMLVDLDNHEFDYVEVDEVNDLSDDDGDSDFEEAL